jgi:hypothetical protein
LNSTAYIAISIVVLAVLTVLFFLPGKRKREKPLTRLAALAFAFVLAGIFFGENRFLGYGLIAVGVGFAVADMIRRSRRRAV